MIFQSLDLSVNSGISVGKDGLNCSEVLYVNVCRGILIVEAKAHELVYQALW